MGSNLAPDQVLKLLNSLCKRTRKVKDCTCLIARLKSYTLCTAKCDNMVCEEELREVPSQNNEEQEDVVSEHDVIFANLVKAVVSGIVSREAQQLPCLFC